ATSGAASATVDVIVTPPRLTRAFLWSSAGGIQELGALPDLPHSAAAAINAAGVVVGSSWKLDSTITHAFRWTTSGGMTDLGVLPSSTSSSASAVNGAGIAVGTSGASASTQHAVLWSVSGAIRDLGTLPGDFSSSASGIDDAGRVVGVSWSPVGSRAFIWTEADGMHTIPGLLLGYSDARGVNAAGVVVGVDDSNGAGDIIGLRPFAWTAASGRRELPLVKGDSYGLATAVDDQGDVLGTSLLACSYSCDFSGDGLTHSLIWTAGGDVVDLTAMLGAGAYSAAIGPGGEVVGVDSNGRAFVWDDTGVHHIGTLPGKTTSVARAINAAGQVVGSSH
ncbi:MAG: Extracellular, partial [Gemmatimonadetes bacterium]|nr:Extracellular [Gemmatimonadota bacterium]